MYRRSRYNVHGKQKPCKVNYVAQKSAEYYACQMWDSSETFELMKYSSGIMPQKYSNAKHKNAPIQKEKQTAKISEEKQTAKILEEKQTAKILEEKQKLRDKELYEKYGNQMINQADILYQLEMQNTLHKQQEFEKLTNKIAELQKLNKDYEKELEKLRDICSAQNEKLMAVLQQDKKDKPMCQKHQVQLHFFSIDI